jgi:serine/threonine-protein kinase
VEEQESMTTIGAPGDVIAGRYRLIRELERSATGAVFEAENLRTRRWVSLRMVRSGTGHAEALARFEREARVAEQLRHPHLIDVLDRGDDPERGVSFIVHELLSGGDLGQCLQTVGALPPQVALATLLPVMEGLAAAHARAVVHGAVEPSRIFLHAGSWGVTPKVIDFGLAKIEGLEDERDLDEREDVRSMGRVLSQCLPPAEALPADLAAVIERAVEPERERRWGSMEEFAAALRGCAVWQGVDAERAQRWVVNARGETADPAPAVEVVEPTAVEEEPVAPRRGGRWRPMAAMAAMALVGAVALWPRAPSVTSRPSVVSRLAASAAGPIVEREAATAATAVVATTATEADAGADAAAASEEAPAVSARPSLPRDVRRVNPVIRRGQRAPARAPSALGTRGFNGAPIID